MYVHPLTTPQSMAWLSESSMDNLLDVYKLHCRKEPPQSKDARNVFIDGTSSDVLKDFQVSAISIIL